MATISGSLSDSDSEEDGLQIDKRGREDGDTEGPPQKMARVEKKEGSEYSDFAAKMMARMGYQKGKGLGKHEQGRVEIVEASKQRGRRGLGLQIRGLEPSDNVDWDFTDDHVIIDEEVDWLPTCNLPVPSIEEMREWKVIGQKKLTIDDETKFCDPSVLKAVLSSKSIFDQLEGEELRRARTRSNPYETIRGAFFLNRAAMKMANMDAVLDFMFTNPKSSDGRPLLGHSDILYFADVCAGPGGFSEYILWRMKGDSKGFGMTLKGPCDFKLMDFYAGPPEMFEPHYGVGGAEGDGDIFRAENQAEFIKFVKENTNGKGVHFVMADGGFSVEGQENIQEILSKQLYLCQFLVAISILAPEGHFVCKLFDLFTPFSNGLVYLMYRAFHSVSIYKPVTSRPANSERYIVCKNLRADADAVRQYMHEINLDLNKFSGVASNKDVSEIVPFDMMENDEEFSGYMFDSNNLLGQRQILNLRKIQAFTRNSDLRDDRQAETREKCLQKWQVPDEVRAAPPKQNPKTKFEELFQDEDMDFLYHNIEELSPDNLSVIKSPYDYRCYVLGGVERKRWYLLGLGRTHVFKWDGGGSGKWRKLSEDNLQLELPANTLMEVELVQEMKGEGMGQKRLMTIHALDALFLYGKDVRKLHYNERMEKLRKFVKCITKPTRSDLTQIVVPYVYRLEEIHQIFDKLEFRRVKGSSNPRLCYFPPDRLDSRCFLPSGVCIVKTVKEPWTIALSKSQGRKYFYNLHKRESRFDCPPDSIATVGDCKLHSLIWKFEEGVKIHEQQNFMPNPDKLSKDNIIDCVHRLVHR